MTAEHAKLSKAKRAEYKRRYYAAHKSERIEYQRRYRAAHASRPGGDARCTNQSGAP